MVFIRNGYGLDILLQCLECFSARVYRIKTATGSFTSNHNGLGFPVDIFYAGTMNLDIHGGGLVSIEQLLAAADAAAGVDASATEDKTKTTESKLLEIEKEPANNDIVIEPGAGPVMTEAEQKKAVRDAVKAQDRAADEAQDHVFLPSFNKKEPSSPRKTFTTDYVIDNVIHATIHIKDKE